MSEADVEKEIETLTKKAAANSAPPGSESFSGLLGTIMFAGKDKEITPCPIFLARLRCSPALNKMIREMMQVWNPEEAHAKEASP